jgi:hypothetical protein
MTDEVTTPSEAAPVSLPEIAQQIAGFEGLVVTSVPEVPFWKVRYFNMIWRA